MLLLQTVGVVMMKKILLVCRGGRALQLVTAEALAWESKVPPLPPPPTRMEAHRPLLLLLVVLVHPLLLLLLWPHCSWAAVPHTSLIVPD